MLLLWNTVAVLDERRERVGSIHMDSTGDQLPCGRRTPVSLPVPQRSLFHARRPTTGSHPARPSVLVSGTQDPARVPTRVGEHLRLRRGHGGHAALRRVPPKYLRPTLLSGQLQTGHEHMRRQTGRGDERGGGRGAVSYTHLTLPTILRV